MLDEFTPVFDRWHRELLIWCCGSGNESSMTMTVLTWNRDRGVEYWHNADGDWWKLVSGLQFTMLKRYFTLIMVYGSMVWSNSKPILPMTFKLADPQTWGQRISLLGTALRVAMDWDPAPCLPRTYIKVLGSSKSIVYAMKLILVETSCAGVVLTWSSGMMSGLCGSNH